MAETKRPLFKSQAREQRPRASRRSLWRAMFLALLVHVLLGALLFVGIRWKTAPPEPESAELFSPPPQAAMKAPPEPRPEPVPEVKPVPPPVAKAEPKPQPKADIDTEKAPRKSETKPEKKTEPKPEPKPEPKKSEPKPEPKPDKKPEARKAEPDKPRETPKKAADKTSDSRTDEAKREEFVKSMMAKAGQAQNASSGSSASAPPGLTAGTDRGYGAKIAAALKSRTNYQIPDDLQGNPEARFLVRLKPDCGIISVELKKSSGVSSWDQAAERGIRLTNPFPAMSNGLCDAVMDIGRSPKD